MTAGYIPDDLAPDDLALESVLADLARREREGAARGAEVEWRGGPVFPAIAERIASAIPLRTSPRVHAIVSPVAQPLVANVAAAAGIDISMSTDAGEVAAMAPRSDAILVNLGMLDAERREGALAAVRSGRPFVLDPVKVDRSPDRLAFARELLAYRPAVVKANVAEMLALGPVPDGTVRLTTGPRDVVRRGEAVMALANGHPLLDRVVATGCALGALVAGRLASLDPVLAAATAVSQLNLAAEQAADGAGGPGSFAVRLLDALAGVTAATVRERLRLLEPAPDVSLYLVLGPDVPDAVALAREAVAGGVTLVQWRDKSGDTARLVAGARALAEALPVPVFVNDRTDVAKVSGAFGVHVGHGDLDASAAAHVSGRPVGVTIHSLAEAEAALAHPFAYASVGGVYATTSKRNPHPPIGIDGFAAIARRLRAARPEVPVCAIAGIDERRAADLVRAGADGIAVMSAITGARDPRAAAMRLRTAVEDARAGRREAAE